MKTKLLFQDISFGTSLTIIGCLIAAVAIAFIYVWLTDDDQDFI